ncbi:cytochrome P450 [Talaromyces proteolyticus]|uniref:Cytochrome P450 n=1 Tax=Talaromyces proteolyticus TaxID=1131652 RepID=A0AAD4KTT1_9EURO|nr:cytochrome P450 [Talaromyces proteolyticus]KAH8699136.1 cytochrome P450 [Talaromyces proteolyticus]
MLDLSQILILGLVAVLGFVVYRWRSHDAQEPPVVASAIPIFGHLIGLLWYGISYFGQQAIKHSIYPIFSLDLIFVKIYVIGSPSLVRNVQQNSKILTFEPFMEFSAKRMAGLSPPALEMLKLKQASGHSLFTDILHGMFPTLLGESLDRMNERMIRLLRPFIDELGSGGTIDWYEWTRHAITVASTDSSYGDMNPYKDQKIEDAFWDFDNYLSPLIANILPLLTARPAWKGRENLIDALEDYYNRGGHENSSDLTFARFKIPRDAGMSVRDIARLEATMAFGLLSNTAPAAFWVLYDIFSRSDLLEEIREEVRENALHVMEDGTHIIDLADLRDDCPLMISTFQEILRTRSSSTSTRFVTKEVMVGERYLLKEGNVVVMPAISIGRKSDVWGATNDDFDPRRFMKPTAPDKKSEGKKDPRRVGGFMAFGVSPVICPGRHFASGEILGLIAMTAMRFDVLPVGGVWKDPKANAMAITSIMNPPKESFNVNVRPRKEFEGTSWDFKVTEGKSKYPLVIG